MAARSKVLLGLCALACLLQLGAAARVTPKKHPCPDIPPKSDDAFKTLVESKGNFRAKHLSFITALSKCRLTATFKKLARGKVIISPTMHAIEKAYLNLGLLNGLPGMQPDPRIPKAACDAVRKDLPRLVANAKDVAADAGCWLVFSTKDVKAPLKKMVYVVDFDMGKTPTKSKVKAQADEQFTQNQAPPYNTSAPTHRAPPGTISQYSILGTGYNMYLAFPLSAGLAAMDPGFTLEPIYALDKPEHVATMSPTGGSCETKFSTSTAMSEEELFSDMKFALNDFSINIGEPPAPPGGKQNSSMTFNLVLSGQYNKLKNDVTSSSMTVTSSSAKVYIGGYGLRGMGVPFHKYFIDTVDALCGYYAVQDADPTKGYKTAFASFIDNYGTHYINRVFYGGLAAMTFSMSADTSAKLSNMSLSGSIEGKIGGIKDMGVLSLKATGSMVENNVNEMEKYSTTFGMVLMPAAVELALTATTIKQKATQVNVTTAAIDCNAWTTRIQGVYDTDRWMTPVMYGFAGTPGLLQFAESFEKCGTNLADRRVRLGRLQNDLQKFIDTCQYANPSSYALTDGKEQNYCPKSRSKNCVSGSYRPPPPNDAACVSCFKSSNSPADGPNCDFNKAESCFLADSTKPYGVGRGCCDEDGKLIKKDATDTSDPKLCFDLEQAAKKAAGTKK